MKTSFFRPKAFTLIELLVVIAIIAILAAILFPVFAQAKLAAKKTVDLSNIKNIGLSMFIYQPDYDDTLPTIRNDPGWGGTCPTGEANQNCFETDSMMEQLAPYIKSHAIWASPEDTISHCSSNTANGCSYAVTGGPVSYVPTYNAQQDVLTAVSTFDASEAYGVFGMPISNNCAPNGWGAPCTGSLTTSQLSSPSDLIIMAPAFISWSFYSGSVQQRNDQREFSFSALGIPDYPTYTTLAYAWCCANDGWTFENFNGQANWLFADSHVKSMARNATMDPTWYSNPALAISSFKKNLLDANPGYN
jgi:prepilin-type N-terminal cleavage/methylation domain-containing protein/prepilin-type processing-associated H-X9-DG protein